MVGPRVAAAAAQRALEVLAEEDPAAAAAAAQLNGSGGGGNGAQVGIVWRAAGYGLQACCESMVQRHRAAGCRRVVRIWCRGT